MAAKPSNKIHRAMIQIMNDVRAVEKDGHNKHGGYDFRSIDEIMSCLQPALVRQGVVIVPQADELQLSEYQSKGNTLMHHAVVRVQFMFVADDGTSFETICYGEGSDSGDKAINKAHTSAYKNAIVEALCLPTYAQDDSEYGDLEPQPEPEPKRKAAPKKEAEAKEKGEPNGASGGQRFDDQGHELMSDDDLENIKGFVRTRCKQIKLDPADYMRICLVDVMEGADLETLPQMQRADLNFLRKRILAWEPKDTAPGFTDSDGEEG